MIMVHNPLRRDALSDIFFFSFCSYAFCFINAKRGNPLTLFIYPIIVTVVFGLREVANAIADPFGTDATDFNQTAIVDGIYNECKKLCEEPEEPFLSSLGDPDFNPKRNEDGTLCEETADPAHAEQEEGERGQEEEEKMMMWPDNEVQPIIEERKHLENEVRFGQIQKLKVQVGTLVDVTTEAMEKLVSLEKAPPQLEILMGQMHARVDRLEALMTNQMMKMSGELRGDPYESRYIGEIGSVAQVYFFDFAMTHAVSHSRHTPASATYGA
jgi:hypothetical protein